MKKETQAYQWLPIATKLWGKILKLNCSSNSLPVFDNEVTFLLETPNSSMKKLNGFWSRAHSFRKYSILFRCCILDTPI